MTDLNARASIDHSLAARSVSPPGAPLPEVIYVELSDYCNLNCVFCGRENEIKTLRDGDVGGFAELEKVKMLERPLRAAKYLGLSGRIGEPLLYPRLRELLHWLYDINPGIKLRVTTNGTALSRKMADLMRGRIDFVAISLNAANASAYARDMRPVGHRAGMDWTPNWGNFTRRIGEFIEALPDADRPRIRIIAPVHRDNIGDVPDFVRLVAKLGCTHAILTPMQVHDDANIDASIYWFKDEYNDVIDEVTSQAALMGVKVEAARFYASVKTDLSIESLCHEPSTAAYLNMGPSQSRGAPCCQWIEPFSPMDVYGDPEAFERFWNSDVYRRLRTKRDFQSCKACGLTRAFDEVMFHFTPLLKLKLVASKRIEEAEECSNYPDHDLVRACRALSVDVPSIRRTVTQLGIGTERIRAIEKSGIGGLRALDRDCWEAFLATDRPPAAEIDLMLGGCFSGIGWFDSDNIPAFRVSARWMGGGRSASVFLRVAPGQAYQIRVKAHHIASSAMARGLGLALGGQPLDVRCAQHHDESAVITACVPSELASMYDGRLWLSIGYDDSHGQGGWASFSHLQITPASPR